MKNGGYDLGYKNCGCFWGHKAGSLIYKIDDFINNYKGLNVLDLGCGEAKNAIYLSNKGCFVDAIDISKFAIKNANDRLLKNKRIKLKQADVLKFKLSENHYDIIIAYGLFHCLKEKSEIIYLISKCMNSLKLNGYFIVCAFNSRRQELSIAHKDFKPLLLQHKEYLSFFDKNKILYESDNDLFETHPHNKIPHTHSMTRLIINKLNG
ncbi:MAG: class I SAM-dependent methyltransferase [Nitrospinae bacterium]|nr:class I SAM-dependent methyltransferase [Nitrospinota bacterium]